MAPAAIVPPSAEKADAILAAFMRAGMSRPDAMTAFEEHCRREVWRNRKYVVGVERREDGSVSSLSIRRDDRKPIHDWRDLQRIKNEIAGPEIEALELYPAMSRLMDTSNQYWLWCLPPGERITAGFETGALAAPEEVAAVSAVQRRLPEEWHSEGMRSS